MFFFDNSFYFLFFGYLNAVVFCILAIPRAPGATLAPQHIQYLAAPHLNYESTTGSRLQYDTSGQ